MIIKRNRYLKQIITKKRDGMIKIVTGIRRCGKSYLLNVLFRKHLLEEGIHLSYERSARARSWLVHSFHL